MTTPPNEGLTRPSLSTPSTSSALDRQQGTLLCGVAILSMLCCLCCIVQYRAVRRRQEQYDEQEPLLADGGGSSRHGGDNRTDLATIGTPARDFVRLSSLPTGIFQLNENRCRSCGVVGECVALRPCGHMVLCWPCSDFVFECPHCGQYISGIHIPPQGLKNHQT